MPAIDANSSRTVSRCTNLKPEDKVPLLPWDSIKRRYQIATHAISAIAFNMVGTSKKILLGKTSADILKSPVAKFAYQDDGILKQSECAIREQRDMWRCMSICLLRPRKSRYERSSWGMLL